MLDPLESFVIFPISINSTISVNNGRKYPKHLAISNPTFKEIKSALDNLKFTYSDEPNKRHPKDFNEKGLFRVDKSLKKKEVVEGIIKFIAEAREKKTSVSVGNNNALNLIPKRKEKKNKKQ